MLIEYFEQYVKVTRGITDSSVGHYITGLNSINALLVKYGFPIKSVFEIGTREELEAVKAFLETNSEFVKKDAVGHHMYSVAFKHFYRFACEDNDFFQENIQAMDIVVPKPKSVVTTTAKWKRNQIVINQAIEGANYRCEHNDAHNTFVARSTGKAYMEGHHLIPMRFQPAFENSLDIYANVVCLCPTCHRLMHFGRNSDKSYVAEALYEKRAGRLSKSGIDLPKTDFLELVIT